MKKYLLLSILALASAVTAMAQNASSISSSLGLFVFPGEGQDQKQQEADEMACFNWAKQQTGYDPINPTQVVGAKVSGCHS